MVGCLKKLNTDVEIAGKLSLLLLDRAVRRDKAFVSKCIQLIQGLYRIF